MDPLLVAKEPAARGAGFIQRRGRRGLGQRRGDSFALAQQDALLAQELVDALAPLEAQFDIQRNRRADHRGHDAVEAVGQDAAHIAAVAGVRRAAELAADHDLGQ